MSDFFADKKDGKSEGPKGALLFSFPSLRSRPKLSFGKVPIILSVIIGLFLSLKSCGGGGSEADPLARGGSGLGLSAASASPAAESPSRSFLSWFRSGNPGGLERRQPGQAEPSARLPALTPVALPRLPVSDMVASGDFGPADASGKLPQPQSIRGIMSPKEAALVRGGVPFSRPGEARGEPLSAASAASPPGSPPQQGPEVANAPYVGQALDGPGAAADPDARDAKELGVENPNAIRGASQGSTNYTKGSVSRGHLRAFLGNHSRVTREDALGFSVDKTSSRAVVQLAQAKVTSTQYAAAPTSEGKAMVGIVYDGHKPPGQSISSPPGIVTDVGGGIPNTGPQDQDPNKAIADLSQCADSQDKLMVCANDRDATHADTTDGKGGWFVQMADLDDQLTDLGIRLAIDCGGKCGPQCGKCNQEVAQKQTICDEMERLRQLINGDCQGVPRECMSMWAGTAAGKRVVQRVRKLGDCSVDLSPGGPNACGHTNSFWGNVYCTMQDFQNGFNPPAVQKETDQESGTY